MLLTRKNTMKPTAIAAALVCVASIYGCATPEQIRARQEGINSFIMTRPECSSDEQCKRAWSAAQGWVSQNCGMKIQIATDSLIETYGSPQSSMALACKVVKQPSSGGSYIISFDAGCGNFLGCNTDPLNAGMTFNSYVNSVMGDTSTASKHEPPANKSSETQSDGQRCDAEQIKRMRESNLTIEQITSICSK